MKNLFLLHGWAANSRIWEPLRTALADRARLFAPDLPGWEAAWVRERLEAMDPADTVLVGWSLGGMLALEAGAAGYRPRALILLAACASFCRRPDYALGVPPAVVRGMRQRLRAEPGPVVQDFHRQLLAAGESHYQDELQNLLPGNQDPVWLAQGLAYLGAKDLRELLPRVKSANLVVVQGERDRIVAPAQAYFLLEQLPGARLVLLPGAGHAPMVTRIQELTELIMEYL